jgi:hypothetical protein
LNCRRVTSVRAESIRNQVNSPSRYKYRRSTLRKAGLADLPIFINWNWVKAETDLKCALTFVLWNLSEGRDKL